ncbi:hypothetical protein [Acetobacterium wieringae]|uniref:Uncharacterized protein n=1 Tax=Acetobacterium wieringae TaxID=52694 RepID=A0A1F2PE54_9FIRM|nr:hypothetical protein [Acetobacterium wieringae]OFV68926.1 hypothetical protein ACWI_36170 [Acetobacterium wieringae]
MNVEDIKFLIELQGKLNSQENDGNANPVFWGVMEEQKVPALPGCEDGVELAIDSERVYSEDELDELKQWMSDVGYFNECELDSIYDLEDAKGVLIEKDIDCEIYTYRIEGVLTKNTGAFLTKEACREYIDQFGYNHSKPYTYAMTAYRNFELEKLLKIIKTADFEILLEANI